MDKTMVDIIKISKSRNEVLLKYFGYNNKRAYQFLNEFILQNEIDASHLEKKIKICPNCNKIVKKKGNKFCNSSCSATFNNKRRLLSNDTKNRISNSLLKRTHQKREYKCVVCGDDFIPKRGIKGRLSPSKCCSDECRKKLRSQNGKKTAAMTIANGTHKGWQSRNIESYPEKFFKKVLANNNIKYEHNYPVNKKELGLDDPYNYFLDFFIESKKIDLEIDGKQHKERKEHDEQRDDILIKNGYYVYRIKWKNISTKIGQEYIKSEIDKFLKFYNEYGACSSAW